MSREGASPTGLMSACGQVQYSLHELQYYLHTSATPGSLQVQGLTRYFTPACSSKFSLHPSILTKPLTPVILSHYSFVARIQHYEPTHLFLVRNVFSLLVTQAS